MNCFYCKKEIPNPPQEEWDRTKGGRCFHLSCQDCTPGTGGINLWCVHYLAEGRVVFEDGILQMKYEED